MDERDFWGDLERVMAKIPATLLYSKNGVTEILFFTQFMEDPPTSYRERKEIVKAAFRAERQRRQGQCTPTKI